MTKAKSILLVGVGGQGINDAANILSDGLMAYGYDVKTAKISGISQRGGCSVSQIRYGERVYSPTIDKGDAEIIVAFESMEGLRWLGHLKPGGRVILSDYKLPSVRMNSGFDCYPENVIKRLREKADITLIDAAGIANDLGNGRIMNLVLLGALVKVLDLESIDWETVVRENSKEKYCDINITALIAGIACIND